MIEQDFEHDWKQTVAKFERTFGSELDLQAMLFLVGVNELGQGPAKWTKDQKIDVLHIGVCSLLAPFGYYEFKGRDADGWPHFERSERLPKLSPAEQERLMKEALMNYSREW